MTEYEVDELLAAFQDACTRVAQGHGYGSEPVANAAKERAIFRNEIRQRLLGTWPAASLSALPAPGEET